VIGVEINAILAAEARRFAVAEDVAERVGMVERPAVDYQADPGRAHPTVPGLAQTVTREDLRRPKSFSWAFSSCIESRSKLRPS
jgi:hypothetical protein